MNDDPLDELKQLLREFVAERDWDQFHSPKNLSMAICGEAGELVSEFQWQQELDYRTLPDEKIKAIRYETADILIYLVRLADKMNFNLMDAAFEKIDINKTRYPVEKSKGNSRKYNEL